MRPTMTENSAVDFGILGFFVREIWLGVAL